MHLAILICVSTIALISRQKSGSDRKQKIGSVKWKEAQNKAFVSNLNPIVLVKLSVRRPTLL